MPQQASRRPASKVKVVIVALACLALLTANVVATHAVLTSRFPGGNDSIGKYYGTRAWLLEGRSPYDPIVSRRAQIAIYGRLANDEGEDKAHFVSPFYIVLFYLQAAFLNFEWARAVGTVMLELSLAATVVFSARLWRWAVPAWLMGLLVVWVELFYHGARTIILWQFAGISAALLTIGLWAIGNRRDVLAGCCFALSTAKPQMAFLLFPLLFMWSLTTGRRRLAVSLVVSITALCVASLVFVPTWPLDMIRQMREYQTYTFIGSPVHILTEGLVPPLGQTAEALVITALVGWLLLEWWRVRHDDGPAFQWTLALTLVVTNLVALRTATTNYVMMVPALMLLFAWAERRSGRLGRAAVLLTLAVTLIGLWVLFAASVIGREEQAIMYLPLPIGLLVGLAVARPARVRVQRADKLAALA